MNREQRRRELGGGFQRWPYLRLTVCRRLGGWGEEKTLTESGGWFFFSVFYISKAESVMHSLVQVMSCAFVDRVVAIS